MATRWAIANGNFSSTATWNDGAILGIPTGSDDLFTNTFTVNVNQSFSAISLNNTARARDIATPAMTANNAPSPFVVYGTGASPYLAFDRNTSTLWRSDVYSQSGNLVFDFSTGVIIDGYQVDCNNSSQINNPRNWTFEGSNDNSSWTILHTVSQSAGIPSSGNYSVASIGNSTSYRYYKLNISLNGGDGNWLQVTELNLYQPGTAGLAAGGSFNFNTGDISGSVTSYGIGATIINVTAPSGTVELISPSYFFSFNSLNGVINHSGNCNFILRTGGIVTNGANVAGIGKSGTGTLTIYGSLFSGGNGSSGASTFNITLSGGNLIVYGDIFATAGRGGGASILGNSATSNLTIYGNITGLSSVYNNPAISWTSAAGIITVAGNVTGGNGHGITTNAICIISGSLIGGGTSTFAAVNTTNTLRLTGNAVGGTLGNAIITTAPVVITGSVTTAGAAPSITSTAAMFVTVSGSVEASSTANAISLTNASAVVNLAGNLVNVNGKQAIYCQNLFLDNTATTQARFFTFGGSDRTLYSSDTFPNLPSTSNVRFGTTYGPGSGNTGTLRMASPQDVRSGVLTDNTTGSAILSMESLSNEIQTSTDPFAQRLKNLTTVDIIGNLLTAFKK
jgi:hypothetical protein